MASTTTHPSSTPASSISVPVRVLGAMVAAVSALLLVLSLGMTRAGAQNVDVTYPPQTTIIEIIPGGGDDDIVEAGEPVVFVADGFEPGTTVTLTVFIDITGDGVPEEIVLTAVANEDGVATFEWQVPAGAETGDYTVEFEGIDDVTGAPRTATGVVHIEAVGAFVPGDGGGGPLPYTGSNSTTLVRIAVVLLLAGGVSVVAVRRRNAHSNA